MVRGSFLLLVFILIPVVILGKGSGLPERHVQVYLFTVSQTWCIQPRGDGKHCAPLPPKESGSEAGEPRNLVPWLGVG